MRFNCAHTKTTRNFQEHGHVSQWQQIIIFLVQVKRPAFLPSFILCWSSRYQQHNIQYEWHKNQILHKKFLSIFFISFKRRTWVAFLLIILHMHSILRNRRRCEEQSEQAMNKYPSYTMQNSNTRSKDYIFPYYDL